MVRLAVAWFVVVMLLVVAAILLADSADAARVAAIGDGLRGFARDR